MSVSTASKTDKDVQDRVEKELRWARQVDDAANIGVAVHDGVVTLTGEVKSFAQKVAAGKAALRTWGVTAIANDIEIIYPGHPKTDAEIAENARNVLRLNANIPDGAVKVEVRHGVATLTGAVDWNYVRLEAKRAVQNLVGVKGVANQITLTPRVSGLDTEKMIKAALMRNASVDANSIHVNVIGNKVVLHGTVGSYAEKKQAGYAAWSSPHVSEVDNQIVIRTH
ncbi:BON domain-containing protein [Aeromicrobium terrae]|uniref:BON domain-containing protein n=1 Tax=Aeromicrobium terrae TaxID=2498846 RepID=A0A5C8NFE2_9ACTN|nr:BON domain-containing protein [Aeromicrobium terrae]TXL57519.1 BON domain-containing protein [Aeromicrobium terrae]